MELGKNIVTIRKQNNLTQDAFAEKYFVTRQTVSNWENSKSYPDLKTLIKISDDFNISLDILLKEDAKMISDISEKQNNYKWISIFLIALNTLGILLLLYFGIPYVIHANTLNGYSRSTCGFILTVGMLPLFLVNLMTYLLITGKRKTIRLMCFIPGILCLLLVIHYIFSPQNMVTEENTTHITSMKCVLDGEWYLYSIYENDDGTLSVRTDDNYDIPSSEIDYSSVDTIVHSIETHFKENGGFCP